MSSKLSSTNDIKGKFPSLCHQVPAEVRRKTCISWLAPPRKIANRTYPSLRGSLAFVAEALTVLNHVLGEDASAFIEERMADSKNSDLCGMM